jgi:hypothetical protein
MEYTSTTTVADINDVKGPTPYSIKVVGHILHVSVVHMEQYALEWELVDFNEQLPIQLFQVRLFFQTYNREKFFNEDDGGNRLEYPHCFMDAITQADKELYLSTVWNRSCRTQVDMDNAKLRQLDDERTRLEDERKQLEELMAHLAMITSNHMNSFSSKVIQRPKPKPTPSSRGCISRVTACVLLWVFITAMFNYSPKCATITQMCYPWQKYAHNNTFMEDYCKAELYSQVQHVRTELTPPNVTVTSQTTNQLTHNNINLKTCPYIPYYMHLWSCPIADTPNLDKQSTSIISTMLSYPHIAVISMLQLTASYYMLVT